MNSLYTWEDSNGNTNTIIDFRNEGWRFIEGRLLRFDGRRHIETTEARGLLRKIEDCFPKLKIRYDRRVTVGNQCELHADESNGFSGYPFNLETNEWACGCVDASEEHAADEYIEQLQLDAHTIVYGQENCSIHRKDYRKPLYCNSERTHLVCGCQIKKVAQALPELPEGYTISVSDPKQLVKYAENSDQFEGKFKILETSNIAFPATLCDIASGSERAGRFIYKRGHSFDDIVNFQFEDGKFLFDLQ